MTTHVGQIVFCSSDGSHLQICTIYEDGSGFAQLTSDTNDYHWARWSKDGTKILAGGSYGGTDQLFVMNADGTGVTQITNVGSTAGSMNFYQGDWSPDGTKAVVLGTVTGAGGSAAGDLQIVNVDNSGHTAVTLSEKWALYANSIVSWSPDGTKFAFTSMVGTFGHPGYRLLNAVVCNIDGSGSHRVLDASGATYLMQYVPWRWFPDSSNLLVAQQEDGATTSVTRFLKADGTTTTILGSPAAQPASMLGAMSDDAGIIVCNNSPASGVEKFINAASPSTIYSNTHGGSSVSSDGLDYKGLTALLNPGYVQAGTPQQGSRRG